MRTTLEIINAVEAGGPAEPRELRLALLVMETVARIATHELEKLACAAIGTGPDRVETAVEAEGVREGLVGVVREDPTRWLAGDPALNDRLRVATSIAKEVGL